MKASIGLISRACRSPEAHTCGKADRPSLREIEMSLPGRSAHVQGATSSVGPKRRDLNQVRPHSRRFGVQTSAVAECSTGSSQEAARRWASANVGGIPRSAAATA